MLFIGSGVIDWPVAIAVALGSLAGGVLGVRLARRLEPAVFRWFAIVVAVGSALVLGARAIS